MEKIAETELSDVTATLDIRIDDFLTTTCFKEVSGDHPIKYNDCMIRFIATVFPKGFTDDWLSVLVRVSVNPYGYHLEMHDFKWAVSIVDIAGRTRFTRYFQKSSNTDFTELSDYFYEEFPDKLAVAHYLKRSFILERADEFLSDGTLFLRCDIYLDLSRQRYEIEQHINCLVSYSFRLFSAEITKSVCYKNASETGNSSGTCTVFDFTGQVLSLPQFHELRKRFGVFGIYPTSKYSSSVSKENITDILEHVWIFDTRTDRFLLSLAPKPHNLGRLLVDASPVIRKFIETPMKEQREKRIEFRDVYSQPFERVLQFLRIGKKFNLRLQFDEAVCVYQFSHKYEMENLQRICAEYLARDFKYYNKLEYVEEIAESYSDDYLFGLLQSRKREISECSDTFLEDERPNCECYI